MEREEGEGREMRKGRRGIVIVGMVIGLLLGCNNGLAELEKKNQFLASLANLGNEFLNVFTSFGEMVENVLGFKTTTKKSDVGAYFKKIQDTVQGTKDKLNKIVTDMKSEGNPNSSGAEGAVNKLVSEKLDKIIEGANKVKEAIGDDTGLIADFGNSGVGAAGDGKSVESLTEGIKKIVDVVLKDKGDPEAGTDKKADALSGSRGTTAQNGEAGKLFAIAAISSDEKKSAADAAKAVGAVTGADILQAMVKDNGDAAKLAKETTGNVGTAPKDATIAGGIALRAMAKKGKFANKSDDDSDVRKSVGDAAISAVTKALDTLTIAIRKTIDEGLKEVKKAMNINANDNPVTSDAAAAK